MIWDSAPWKYELVRVATDLERRKFQRRWSDSSLAKVERDIFYSAYAVRKLLEANKLSDEVDKSVIEATRYPSLGKPIDFLNWDKIEKLFDLDSEEEFTQSIKDFCNQIIHSSIFITVHDDDGRGLFGFFVASDRLKGKWLLRFEIDEIIRLLRLVAYDDIVHSEWKMDERE